MRLCPHWSVLCTSEWSSFIVHYYLQILYLSGQYYHVYMTDDFFTSLTAEPQQSYTLRFTTSSASLGRKIEIYPEIFSEACDLSATVFLVYKTMHVGLQ